MAATNTDDIIKCYVELEEKWLKKKSRDIRHFLKLKLCKLKFISVEEAEEEDDDVAIEEEEDEGVESTVNVIRKIDDVIKPKGKGKPYVVTCHNMLPRS